MSAAISTGYVNSPALMLSACLAGKASDDGLPADRDTTSGSAAYLKIFLIALGFRFDTHSENL